MVLVNGAQGIGTGWSTSVPCYNPVDLIQCIKNKLNGKEGIDLKPWFRGFTGNIDMIDDKKQRTTGLFSMSSTDRDVLTITELPLNRWINDYKTDFLEHNLNVKGGHIEEFFDDGDEHNVRLEVHMEEDALYMVKRGRGGIPNWFNLESDINLTNMVLYNRSRVINKYNNVKEIFNEFYEVRLD